MRARSFTLPGLLIILLATVGSSPATGQERDPKRSLGGHNFIPIQLLGDPFVGTYIRNTTGGGMAVGLKLAIPDLEGGVIGYAEADIGFIALDLEYQQNITNWLAFRFGANGGARLGTSIEALLAEGATALFGYNFGLSAQVVRSNRFALAASADILPNKAYGISPLDFARSVIENGLDSASSLLKKGSGRRIYFGVRPAFVVTDWLGLQGLLDVGPGKTSTDEENEADEVEAKETQTTYGLGASINLSQAIKLPLGVTAAFQHKSGILGQGDVSGGADTWNVGIFYTGRRAFIVGLDIVSSQIGQALTDDKIDLVGARLSLRYDFR